MKKADKISYRQKSTSDLKKLLVDLKKELVENKAKHHTGALKDTSVFVKSKYQIAYINTLLKEKELNHED